MKQLDTNLEQSIQKYCDHIIKNYEAYSSRSKFTHDLGFRVDYEAGSKYVKIFHWYENGSFIQRSVHSFVEKKTGDIWKAASWKSPAKNFTRGNVLTENYKHISWPGC